MTFVTCVLCAILAADAPQDDRPASALTAVQWAALPDDVRALATEYVDAKHWRKRGAVGRELASRGDAAVEALLVILQTAENQQLLQDAFHDLRKHFPNHAATKEFILTQGLRSAHEDIRYESLFHVGEQKWPEAREQLYKQMNDRTKSWNRFVAAKSLAELEDVRALQTLIEAVQHDRYMPRHFGHIGLTALTGKSLNDFDYKYGEGAFVSGGAEGLLDNPDPLMSVEIRIRRYTACRDYLQWLCDNRPEMYQKLTRMQF